MNKIQQLRDLLAKATPGEWTDYNFGSDYWVAHSSDDSGPWIRMGGNHADRAANAALIAAAVNALPNLLDALEAALIGLEDSNAMETSKGRHALAKLNALMGEA